MTTGAPIAGRPRVLVVEDELIVAADIEASLNYLGYDVLGIAETGKQAVRFAEQQSPDLVLMDIHLPGAVDGIAAADEIRRRLNIPVVFLTALVNEDTISRAKTAQPFGYLTKPFRPNELNATLTIALHRRELARDQFVSEGWFSSLLANTTDGVVAVDSAGDVCFLNATAERLTRWTLAEAIGKPVEEVWTHTTLAGTPVESPLRAALKSPKALVQQRFLLKSRDGKYFPVEASTSQVQSAGLVTGAVTVFADISDRGQAQEEESETVSESLYCLRELVAHLLTAQEQEWNRISSELHDDVGQRIAVMELSTATLSQLFKGVPTDVGGVINNLCADVRWIGHSIGRMSRQLYPAIIQHLGLRPAVLSVVDEYRKLGGDLELSMPSLPPVPADVALVVFRILQQVLRARGRSANGSAVKVTLTVKKQELWLAIENAGFANWDVMSAKDRVEWTVMQERARMVKGTLRLAPLTDGGSRIDLRAPVPD